MDRGSVAGSVAQPRLRLHTLPAEVLQLIASHLARLHDRLTLSRVCRAWRAALAGPSAAWERLPVLENEWVAAERRRHGLLLWLAPRAPGVRHALLDVAPAENLELAHWDAVLVLLAPSLSHLHLQDSFGTPTARLLGGLFRRLTELRLTTVHGIDCGALSALTSLRALRCTCHGWTETAELPAALSALTRLTHLGFHLGSLARVPASLSALAALEELELGEGAGLVLEQGCLALPRLRSLLLRGVTLRHASGLRDVTRLTALTQLDIRFTWADDHGVPEWMCKAVQLRSMRCQVENSMRGLPPQQLPKVITRLSALQCLELINVGITDEALPALFQLTCLRRLNLAGNAISSLPPALSSLSLLTHLSLTGNAWPQRRSGMAAQLHVPVDALLNLSELQVLDLSLNRLAGGLPVARLSCLTCLLWLNASERECVDDETAGGLGQLVAALRASGCEVFDQ